MKNILRKVTDLMTDAALLETGVDALYAQRGPRQTFRQSLEDHLVEVGFCRSRELRPDP